MNDKPMTFEELKKQLAEFDKKEEDKAAKAKPEPVQPPPQPKKEGDDHA